MNASRDKRPTVPPYVRAHVAPPSGTLYPGRDLHGLWQMDPTTIRYILDQAHVFEGLMNEPASLPQILQGMVQINMFFEPSTRTLISFEMAGKRLGAETISVPVAASSLKKGESLLDTVATLGAMGPDIFVMRHSESGASQLAAQVLDCPVVNAGDGRAEHPTQALLDALTIERRRGSLHGQTVAICGDILHSRVARSNIFLLSAMGASIRLVGPSALVPRDFEELGTSVFHDMETGLAGADVVMMLRLQFERMENNLFSDPDAYFREWGLHAKSMKYAKDDALVLHPGPMNRGVEIASDIADDTDRCAVLEQVRMGVAVRMAVLDILTRAQRGQEHGVNSYES